MAGAPPRFLYESLIRPTLMAKKSHTAEAQYEQERLFGMNWFAAAHVHELSKPGDVKVIEVGKTSIILTRDKDHKLHAFYNSLGRSDVALR